MANSVTIRTTAPGAKEAAGQLGMLKAQVVGLGSSKAGPLGGMTSGFGGAGLAMLGAVGAGVAIGSVLTDVGGRLGDAANMAIADEKSVAALATTLRANVKDWDGNTDAIDRATEAGIHLGFADDDTRASLQKLVIATGDVTEAIKLSRLAMDVARGRGIDLATATDIVAKANIGNSRALKSMGIDLGTAATRTELLGALTEKFTGQAADFAKTTEGRLTVTNERFNELQETVGYKVLPVIDDAITYFDNLATSIENVGKDMAGFTGGFSKDLGKITHDLEDAGTDGGMALAQGVLDEYQSKMAAAKGIFEHSARTAGSNIADALGNAKGDISGAMDDLMWAINHPLALEKEEARIKGLLVSDKLQKALASENPLIKTQAEQTQQHLIELWQELSGKAWTAGVNAATKLEGGLKTFDAPNFNVPGIGTLGHGGGGGAGGRRKHRAGGGAVDPGGAYIVGENGPELLQMGNSGGNVVPNNKLGGGNITVNVNLSTREFSQHSKHYATMQAGMGGFR